MTQKLSAKEAAAELGTDARTLRKFLRSKSSPIEPVGQGNRYEFTSKEVKTLKKAFLSWGAGAKKATGITIEGTNAKGKRVIVADPEDIDIQDEIDRTTEEVDLDDDGEPVDLDDLEGPSDEDLDDDLDIELLDLDE